VSADWVPVRVEDINVGDETWIDDDWQTVTAVGVGAGVAHINIGRLRLDFTPSTMVMIRKRGERA
jgi:hypothetical protein